MIPAFTQYESIYLARSRSYKDPWCHWYADKDFILFLLFLYCDHVRSWERSVRALMRPIWIKKVSNPILQSSLVLNQKTQFNGSVSSSKVTSASFHAGHTAASNFSSKEIFLNMGLSRPLFGFIFPFSWYMVSLQLLIFTIGKRKEEGRVCTVLLHVIRKSLTPSENGLTAFLN